MTDPFERERAFILNCSFKEEIPVPQLDFDWEFILKESIRHGVAPLIYETLRWEGKFFSPIHQGLEALYYATASKNLHLLRVAGETVRSLKEGGVRALPLKGVSLVERRYGNIALRPFEDIDLLIQKRDFSRARRVLEELDYHPPDYLLPDRFYLDYHFHLPFIKEKPKQVYLELHWDFTDRYMLFTPDMDAVWSRASEVLHPEDELIYLAMHLEKHGYLNKLLFKKKEKEAVAFIFNPLSGNRLIWFVDLRLFLNHLKNQLIWENITEIARQWGARETLGSALFLLEALTGSRGLYGLPCKPKEKLTLTETFLYRAAFRERGSRSMAALLKMDSTTQFRPIRIFDFVHYLFPPGDYLRRCYHYRRPLAMLFYRGYHLIRCSTRDLLRPLTILWIVLIKELYRRGGRFLGKRGGITRRGQDATKSEARISKSTRPKDLT